MTGFTKNKSSCLHQDIRTRGEVLVLGDSLFSDTLPHSDDVNVNIGGPGFHRQLEAGDTGIVASAGDTGIVASRIQGHWGRFRVQIMIFLRYSFCQYFEGS